MVCGWFRSRRILREDAHRDQKIAASRNGFWPRSIFLVVCRSGGNRLSRQPGREADLVERFGLGQWIHLGNGMGFAGGSLRRVTWLGSRLRTRPLRP
jgi:hypothetical protein